MYNKDYINLFNELSGNMYNDILIEVVLNAMLCRDITREIKIELDAEVNDIL